MLSMGRIKLHFAHGVLTGIASVVMPIAAIAFTLGFLTYEVIEDWRVVDRGYQDVAGWLVGLATAMVVLMILAVFGIRLERI